MGMAKSTSSARRPSAGLQVLRNGSSAAVKPRIIHTYSPKVYKIKPEEFLDLVQKLTGRADETVSHVDDSTTSTSQTSQDNVDLNSRLEDHHEADSEQVAGTPVSTQLLASLPSPRFVTLNFLPMLAATPSAFTQSRRDSGFSFPSAAY